MELNYSFDNAHKDETVLLLHGFLSDMDSMKTVGNHLKSHFNVLNVDLPGFGKTQSPEAYTMDDISHSLASLLEELEMEAVHILGYSMGGRVAVSFLVNHPGMVQSAVLESASPGISDPTERRERFLIDQKRAEEISYDYTSFVDGWEKMGLFSTQDSLDSKAKERQRENRLAQDPSGAADSLIKYGSGIQQSYWDDLKDVNPPVLLVCGGRDEKFVTINREMQKLLHDVQFEIVPEAGHNIHMEAADKFGIIILEFLLGG